MTTRRLRGLRALAVAAAAALLAGCTGLPTTGDVKPGLALGSSPEDPDTLPLASGPLEDAGPVEIVDGFIEAAITTTDNWATAQEFLTPGFRDTWRPTAGVSIDESAATREFASDEEIVDGDEEDADETPDGTAVDVQVRIEQIAGVDEAGAYSADDDGPTMLSYTVVKTDGQWRISEAPDGVVIERSWFVQVYDDYALQYFDRTWSRLVPDVRWLPRRATVATSITQALIDGVPSPWLEPAVQSAFPSDVSMAVNSVTLDPDQVATVELNAVAQTLDQMTRARMRTQLQATLEAAGVHVSQVRFSVDGRTLDAGVVKLTEDPADAGSIVLKDDQFGAAVGAEITPIGAISDDLLSVVEPIDTVDVSVDGTHAAVRLGDGRVYVAGDGSWDELDPRAGLVAPSYDPYGFIWSVPGAHPDQLIAWGDDVSEHEVTPAWTTASAVSDIRVSSDGARVAAIVQVGGERWMTVSAVIRDENGVPTALGESLPVARLSGPASGLVWLGQDRVAALVEDDGPKVLVQIVGGTGTLESAPEGAVTIAGARSATGLRVLAADGTLFARSGSAWRQSLTGVTLLATRAGH